MRCVYIPIRGSKENVEVVLDELPEDVDDILNILKAEQAPLDLWLIIAKEYFRQQKIEQFLQILEEGSGPEIAVYYPEPEVKYDRIAILNARGAYYSYLGKAESRRNVKERHFLEASKCYNIASTIDLHEPSTWIGKGQLLLAKGELDQSYDAFSLALERDRNNVVALIGQASVLFARDRYADSLNLYKKCLRTYPDAPGVRLGFAFCHFKLGNSDKAQRAFRRVLQVDPENVEALIVAGACEVQTGEADGIRNGMEKMKKAFDIYPFCSTALNCLANHFFMTGQHFLVEQLCESALIATKDDQAMAHSYYNVGRSYHAKGNYERAGVFYMKSVKQVDDPKDFVLPFHGLGQVQMKLGDLESASENFEKVLKVQPRNPETLKALGYISARLGNNDRALELHTKATKADPHDPEAFMDLAELLVTTDTVAALNAFITARDLLKKRNEEVPFELHNNIGALHLEKGDFDLAAKALKEALGDGIWCYLFHDEAIPDLNKISRENYFSGLNVNIHNPDKLEVFNQLEKQGLALELPSDKVTTLFNYARALEQSHETEAATTLYHLILFKYPKYTDAKLRLAAIAKARHQFKKSREMLDDVLKTDKNCTDALLMLGDLELKTDYWVQAKETFREAKYSSDEKDSFAAICLGNWNYYAAMRSENRAPRLEATHYEKAKELYTNVLAQNPHNLYAANGAGLVFAERGKFDIAKDLFLEAQEAASGSSNARIPDIWINLAHIHFGQGNTAMAIKMYENCLHKFYYNTDSQVLLYVARVHYDEEKWNDSRRALLRAIHLDPSNHKFRFNAGLVMQKFSSLTLQKDKKTLIEVRASVSELKNAIRVFSLLSSGPQFEEKKIKPHLDYCNHLLEASSVHCEVAEREEERNKRREEVIRRLRLAEESQKKAEEQRKIQLKEQMEKRKQEEERRHVMEEEKRLARLKEQWTTSKRRRKSKKKVTDEEDGGIVMRRRKRGEKKERKRKDDKGKKKIEQEAGGVSPVDKEEENANKTKRRRLKKKSDCDAKLLNVLDQILAATGLADSDDEENAATGLGNSNVKEEENAANPLMIPRRRAVSDSEDEDK